MSDRYQVMVYGGGAVGLGIASCLLKSGVDTTVLARPSTAAKLKSSGLVRRGIFGEFVASPKSFEVAASPDEVSGKSFDRILVCTKSFDSASAARDLAAHPHLFRGKTAIVLFQNGWGNAEAFVEHFDKRIIFNARVITGFIRSHENEVTITVHADAIHIGSLFGYDASILEPLCRAIRDGGIPTKLTDSIEKDLWAKMLYNCALNPLGAILDVPYGKLAESRHSRAIMNVIMNETFMVMTGSGFHTHWSGPDGFRKIFYERLVPDTALHRSSTLQDLRAGRRTEIDALTGAVLKLAEQHGLDVPHSRILYDMIRFIEAASSHSGPTLQRKK